MFTAEPIYVRNSDIIHDIKSPILKIDEEFYLS